MLSDERRRHLAFLEAEQLASVLNDTKWEAIANAMGAFRPSPNWRCKEISASEPGDWDGDWCYHIRPFHTIEWLEIGFVPGRYPPPPLTASEWADAEERLRATLSALGVPFSLERGIVRVWGYTRPGAQPIWAHPARGR